MSLQQRIPQQASRRFVEWGVSHMGVCGCVLIIMTSPPLKNGIGEGGDPVTPWRSPFVVPFFLLWGRPDKWNWGPPSPLLLKVGGIL